MLLDCEKIAASRLPSWECLWHGAWGGSFGFYYGDTYVGQGIITVSFLAALAVLVLFAWVGRRSA